MGSNDLERYEADNERAQLRSEYIEKHTTSRINEKLKEVDLEDVRDAIANASDELLAGLLYGVHFKEFSEIGRAVYSANTIYQMDSVMQELANEFDEDIS